MFKPLLAAKMKDIEAELAQLKFPVLVSTKLDGIRATVQGGRLRSRTLKDIPNVNVQKMLAGLPEGLDGELIFGRPTAPDVFRQTTSIVMSDDKPAEGIQYFVFDQFLDAGFSERFSSYQDAVGDMPKGFPIVAVAQIRVDHLEELLALEEKWLVLGYEGLMIRSMDGRYKEGRSTMNESILIKLKRFEDAEAVIIGLYEMMHNDNVAQTNELGRTKRSTMQENLRAAGVLGGFHVKDVKTGVEFNVGSGFDAQQKEQFWGERDSLAGKIIKYKSLTVGVLEKPRHPIFLGFRSEEDM
jgi:DNA ligase-1